MLKSDQNGIEIIILVHIVMLIMGLKSDQNGIEIPDGIWEVIGSGMLKSDQNGIEILSRSQWFLPA